METLQADWIICCDGPRNVHRGGSVVHDQGLITWVGETSDLPDWAPAPSGSGTGTVLLPGFVNAHAHSAMAIMRGAADGVPLMEWLRKHIWPIERKMSVEDAYWGAVLGSLEMTSGGITGSAEMYAFDSATIDGLGRNGMKVSMGSTVFGRGGPDGWSAHERLEHVLDLGRTFAGIGVHVDVGLHSLYSCGIDLVEEAAAAAGENGMGVHIHLAETDEGLDGTTEAAQLQQAGLFDVPVLGAHGIHLDDSDMEQLGSSDSFRGIAHCPVSNMRMGSPGADVVGMLKHGIAVGIGTDGPVSGGPLDMFEAMRSTLALARHLNRDPSCLRAADVLEMATSGSAKCAGLCDTGSLEIGKEADIVRIGIDDSRYVPHGDTEDWAVEAVVLRGRPTDVRDVWVDGAALIRNGERVDGVDPVHSTQRAAEQAESLRRRALG